MAYNFNISWFWKKDDHEKVLKMVDNCTRPLVHICSGVSEIGDVRLDARILHVPDRKWRNGSCNVKGDMTKLPFKDGIAGTILCDPPYDYDFTQNQLINELVRISKPRAKIVFIAPWIPSHPTIKMKTTELWVVGRKRPYYKIASIFYKVNGQIGDYVNGCAETERVQ